MPFVRAASVAELAPGMSMQVKLNGRTLALFNVEGTFYAIDDTCPHQGGPLSEGVCEGTEVMCPWHGACFDLVTGAHLSPPAPRGVTTYQVQVEGDDIQIDVP